MRIAFSDFPAEEKAKFALTCKHLGIHPEDFDLEAEIDGPAANWGAHPHVVFVTHRATSRARVCGGWGGKAWTSAFIEHVRRLRFLQA